MSAFEDADHCPVFPDGLVLRNGSPSVAMWKPVDPDYFGCRASKVLAKEEINMWREIAFEVEAGP